MKLVRFRLCALLLVALSTGAALFAGEDPNARLPDSNTPLHLAALRGDADAVDSLLAAGADASATNNAGATPLHYGIISERIVAALLAHGAPADAKSKFGATPLLGAVTRADSYGVARLLVEAGANVNTRRVAFNPLMADATVLTLAIIGGDRRTIALLLENGAEVNPRQGLTPLHAAAFTGDVETARLLLDRGADIDFVPPSMAIVSGPALNFAILSDHTAVAALLLERGADPKVRSLRAYGTTAMTLSGYNEAGDATIARMLLSRGVDVNTANDAGETALSFALKQGSDSPVEKLLRASGANEPATLAREKQIPSRDVPADEVARAAMVRDGTQRAVDILQRTSTAFLENGSVRARNCTSCHQQSLPAVAFGMARERGLRVDEHALGLQLTASLSRREMTAENARELDQPVPGAEVALGYEADGLNSLHYAPDAATGAMSHYLLATQKSDGSWPETFRRPPINDGAIVSTAWCVRAIQLYPPKGRARDAEEALLRARAWLARQTPPSTNLRIFQLLGLAWTGDSAERMRPYADALVAAQRPDGGWSQQNDLASDAWATGSALVALYKAELPTTIAAYQRGVAFLLRTQFDDGSWWVRSRTWPFQPHFDGKFPHGKDQWISAAGTAWATIALLQTMQPTVDPASLPNAQQLIAAFRASQEERKADAAVAATSASTTIDFARDIQPLFDRSCANCHSGAKPKGLFSLTSRESLLKGGQSGDPAVVPGYAQESHLLRYVSDEIEDLEMPPLRRRDKYPALTPEEIARLRTWIDAGAPWPAVNATVTSIVTSPSHASE